MRDEIAIGIEKSGQAHKIASVVLGGEVDISGYCVDVSIQQSTDDIAPRIVLTLVSADLKFVNAEE